MTQLQPPVEVWGRAQPPNILSSLPSRSIVLVQDARSDDAQPAGRRRRHAVPLDRAGPQALLPGALLALVEDEDVPLGLSDLVEVSARLLDGGLSHAFEGVPVSHPLELHHEAIWAVLDQQVQRPSVCGVLPVYFSPAIDHVLQVRHERQVGHGLGVQRHLFGQHVAVLAPPLEEVGDERAEVQAALGREPLVVGPRERLLQLVGELPRQDLAIQRVRRLRTVAALADEPQVEHILPVVVVIGDRVRHVAEQHRLHDRGDPRLLEALAEADQVRGAGADQQLLGFVDVGGGDGQVAVGHQLHDRLAGEHVDQEGLSLGPVKAALSHLIQGEVAQGERLGLDVEGAARVDGRSVFGGRQVVPKLAHADERDRGREMLGAGDEASPELAQQADHRVAGDDVGLVQQQHDPPRGLGLAPGAQPLAKPGAHLAIEPVSAGRRPLLGRELPGSGIFDPRQPERLSVSDLHNPLALLQRGVYRHIPQPAKTGRKRAHRRGLARLAGGVKDKIQVLIDERQQARQAPLGRQHVVLVGFAGASGVEGARHVYALSHAATRRQPWSRPRAPAAPAQARLLAPGGMPGESGDTALLNGVGNTSIS